MGDRRKNSNIDLTNMRFGRLVAIEKVGVARWRCKCDCGNEVVLPFSVVGFVKSCGCLRKECKENFKRNVTKHGEYNTSLYRRYCQIKQRCTNPNNQEYHRYGGRGITICDEWSNSFASFRDWAYENGYKDGVSGYELSIDRIDNNKGYSPENCRFTTPIEQMKNREGVSTYDYRGKKYTALNFANSFGITKPHFVYKELRNGKTLEEILDDWNLMQNIPSYYRESSDVAKELGVTSGHIKRLIRQGRIPGKKICNRWYVVDEKKRQEENNGQAIGLH